MNDKYILDRSGKPVLEPDLFKWARWFESNKFNRRIAYDEIRDGDDVKVRVSTVFLGLDHSFVFPEDSPHVPILYETMIFGGEHDQYQERYATKEEAIEGHKKALRMVTP